MEEDDDKLEDNDMGISALGLDRDLGFCEYIKGIGLMRMTKRIMMSR